MHHVDRRHERFHPIWDPAVIPRVLFVSHEASLTGAPIILLEFLRWLRAESDITPHVLLLTDGELRRDFETIAPVTLIGPAGEGESPARALLRRASWGDPLDWPPPPGTTIERVVRTRARRAFLRRVYEQLGSARRPDLVYLNSIASARALSVLEPDLPLMTHAHEMTFTLNWLVTRSPWSLEQMRVRTNRFVAASGPVASALVDVVGADPARIVVCHEAVPARPAAPRELDRAAARAELALPPDALVVGTVGALNWRKGPDIFLQLAMRTLALAGDRDVRFVWLGPAPDAGAEAQIRHDLAHIGLGDRITFLGPRSDTRPVMDLFDVFVLTSREDPFPLACLEAAALGKPLVCFDAGGMSELIEPDERLVVPYLDVEAMATRVVELLASPSERAALGQALSARVTERHTMATLAPRLLEVIRETLAAV